MRVLIYGGSGLVGLRVLQLLSKDFDLTAPTHKDVDLSNFESVRKNIQEVKPDQILFAAGYTNVDQAQEDREKCFLLNTKVVEVIVERCKFLNIPFHYLSTDYVFNGKKENAPYTEEDKPDPLSVYAKSKREGEIVTLDANSKNSVIRLIMPYSASYERKSDLARTVLTRLRDNQQIFGVIDQNINPIFVDDLVLAIKVLLKVKSSGIYHLGASSFTTPFKFASAIAEEFGSDKNLITQTTFAEFSKTRPTERPQHSWLDTSKFRKEFGDDILHSVEEGIKLFKNQL